MFMSLIITVMAATLNNERSILHATDQTVSLLFVCNFPKTSSPNTFRPICFCSGTSETYA